MALLNDLPGGDIARALGYARKASAAELAYMAHEDMAHEGTSADRGTEPNGGNMSPADFFKVHVANLALAARHGIEPVPALGREALEMAQQANTSTAALAVQQDGGAVCRQQRPRRVGSAGARISASPGKTRPGA